MSNRYDEVIASIDHYISYGNTILFPAPSSFPCKLVSDRFRGASNLRVVMPSDKSDSLLSRLTCAYNHITTDYFVIASDDDLLLSEGISQAVIFLDSHSEYSNYFGESVMMRFAIPYIPIIIPLYAPSNLPDSGPLVNTFKSYRYYPLLYGVSRTEVLKTFISLFPAKLTGWTGIWETNYALAVSVHGKSFYSKQQPFLLRLDHNSFRTSRVDYPKPPVMNIKFEDYLKTYISLDILKARVKSIPVRCDYDCLLATVLIDLIADSAFYDDYPEMPPSARSSLNFCLRAIKTQLVKSIKDPGYIIRFARYLLYAAYYYRRRSVSGVSVLFRFT